MVLVLKMDSRFHRRLGILRPMRWFGVVGRLFRMRGFGNDLWVKSDKSRFEMVLLRRAFEAFEMELFERRVFARVVLFVFGFGLFDADLG